MKKKINTQTAIMLIIYLLKYTNIKRVFYLDLKIIINFEFVVF